MIERVLGIDRAINDCPVFRGLKRVRMSSQYLRGRWWAPVYRWADYPSWTWTREVRWRILGYYPRDYPLSETQFLVSQR